MTNPLDETFRQIREIWEQLPPEMREKAVRRTSYPAEWDFEDVKEYEDRHA